MTATLESPEATAQVDNAVTDPLRECVVNSLNAYFDQVGNNNVTNVYDLVMAEVEIPLFRTVLENTRYNQSRAAKVLGMSRGTLRKKLRQHGMLD